MGLDAEVACDCFERGKFKRPPPVQIQVGQDGFLEPANESLDLDALLVFDEWCRSGSCEHPQQRLVSRHLGNLDAVVLIRSAVERMSVPAPVLLEKVLYHFAHCGDWLRSEDVRALGPELERLEAEYPSLNLSDVDRQIVGKFAADMRDLYEAAIGVGKPIRF